MVLRILSRGAIAAFAGAAMLAGSTVSSPAFTLASPSLEQSVVGADVQSVWWHRGWGWHGGWHRGWGWHGGWHRWGWGGGWHRWGYGPRYGFAPGWHCWWGPWGRRCGV